MSYINPNQHHLNAKRAERLEAVIETKGHYVSSFNDTSDTATDLLTDLMHYCDKYDLDIEEVQRRARYNYLAEITDPEI